MHNIDLFLIIVMIKTPSKVFLEVSIFSSTAHSLPRTRHLDGSI